MTQFCFCSRIFSPPGQRCLMGRISAFFNIKPFSLEPSAGSAEGWSCRCSLKFSWRTVAGGVPQQGAGLPVGKDVLMLALLCSFAHLQVRL